MGCNPSSEKSSHEEPIATNDTVRLIIDKFPNQVVEQSGIIWYNNLMWVINDSGGLPELYAYNKKGELKRTVKVADVQNIDWEALASDADNFYVGDFGNNAGTRKNLKVLKISKTQIDNLLLNEVNAEVISFNWSDQTDFTFRNYKHNFDCEAMFAYNNTLYLFSKNWVDNKTRIYTLPIIKGIYSITPQTVVNTDFMVTGADVMSNGKVIALVGYKNYKTYMYFFYNYNEFDFIKGKTKRVYLKKVGAAQTEGVVFDNEENLYINTEENNQKQALYQINWRKICN